MSAKLKAVRLPEKTAGLRKIREQERAALGTDKLEMVYNSAENLLGIELLRALREGEWVALQADRGMAGLSRMTTAHEGLVWTLPKGPFVLAMMSRSLCLPVLARRVGHRRYILEISAPFRAPEGGDARDREGPVQALAAAWLAVLAPVLRREPEQWLVFEPLVSPAL